MKWNFIFFCVFPIIYIYKSITLCCYFWELVNPCKGFCWLLLRFPLRNLLRIRQIVKAQATRFFVYITTSFVVRRCGEGDSLKCQKISGKKKKTGPNHCRLNSFLNVHKSREKFFSRWFLPQHIIILSHEHGHGCNLFIA